MYGTSSILYSSTGVTSAAGAVSINHHTDAIYFYNTHASTDASIQLNGNRSILIPAGSKEYVCVPGDYTKFEVTTASVTVAVYAIG